MNFTRIKDILTKISAIWQKKQLHVTTFPGKCITKFNPGFEHDEMIPVTWVMPDMDDEKLVDIIHECIKNDLPRKLIDFGELDGYNGFNKLVQKFIPLGLPPRLSDR